MTSLARGRWIPWTFAAGMLVVVVVNGILITVALRSFPGLVVQRPYDRGIAYNDELRQERAQAALGWTMTPAYESGRLTARVAGPDGTALSGLEIKATLLRPLEEMAPIEVSLAPEGDHYAAALELPRRGQWEIRIHAAGSAGEHRGLYRMIVK